MTLEHQCKGVFSENCPAGRGTRVRLHLSLLGFLRFVLFIYRIGAYGSDSTVESLLCLRGLH
jgi:hypothetical protein